MNRGSFPSPRLTGRQGRDAAEKLHRGVAPRQVALVPGEPLHDVDDAHPPLRRGQAVERQPDQAGAGDGQGQALQDAQRFEGFTAFGKQPAPEDELDGRPEEQDDAAGDQSGQNGQ